ncbi:TetR family transcriptional regulator [Afipia sp. P52-10]|jgi:TetR/AcrR family transcriptional repressor of nem operon|uniref:TetR/AcrR family transcriptional regulator n=1 Tax=Afipia sp. P52-10 TaxID=1429916 RepID=UPI0003DEF7A8|nr:TetR/AcrR family transcriptional regulator [Afipia sp. P52-10]ETR78231.1 TetR family transcriptional regulator [Afipia sp. P52-10]
MGHSQADKARSRQRILTTAAKQIREEGLESLSIAKLMQAVNLTHGGFYGHFATRDELVAEALKEALRDGAKTGHMAIGEDRSLRAKTRSYLSRAHRDSPAQGCAISTLSGETARAGGAARAAMTLHIRRLIQSIENALSGDPGSRERAVAIACMMVGAINLSRVADDTALSDEILRCARQAALVLGEGE